MVGAVDAGNRSAPAARTSIWARWVGRWSVTMSSSLMPPHACLTPRGMGDCHEVHAAAEGSADRLFGELTADTAQASGVQHITHAVLADGEIGWLPRVDTLRGPPRLGAPTHGLGHVKEAAESCGVPVQSWRTWEDGGIPRDILRLAKRVSAVTGVNYYWQLDGEAVPMTPPVSTFRVERPCGRLWRRGSARSVSRAADLVLRV